MSRWIEKKTKNDGSCEEELQQLCAGKMLFFMLMAGAYAVAGP